MASEAMKNVFAMIEANAQSRPSLGEFEMAYQVRVAMYRIRFAIRITEMSGQQSEEKTEALTQLADALDRLDSAERGFQNRWRRPASSTKLRFKENEVAHQNGKSAR
jgi:hypothetical protein